MPLQPFPSLANSPPLGELGRLLAGQHVLGEARQITESITGAGRQATEHDDGRRIVGPLRLTPDQPLGPERQDPGQDLGIARAVADQVLVVEQEPGLHGVAHRLGCGCGHDSLDRWGFLPERADPPPGP